MANYEEMMRQAQQMAQQMGMPGGGAPGTPPDMDEMAAYQARAVKLNSSGVQVPATITSLTPTGKVDFGGGKELVFGVTVEPAGGQPYAASFNQYMVDSVMAGVAVGAKINVRVDPEAPTVLMFWGFQG